MSKIAYTLSLGKGDITKKALYLIKSIKLIERNPKIFAFLPKEEVSLVRKNELKEVRDLVRAGDIFLKIDNYPMSKYPMSSKLGALSFGKESSNKKFVVFLDSDILLLDSIDKLTRYNREVYLKPVDVGNQFWARKDSLNDWKKLYSYFGLKMPKFRIRSTFDNRKIMPYWNGGFIFTKRTSGFIEDFFNILDKIYKKIRTSNNFWFADEVALGIASSRYKIFSLNEEYNYPLHLRYIVSPNVKVLHYHKFVNLSKLRGSKYEQLIDDLGLGRYLTIENQFISEVKTFIRRTKIRMSGIRY